jgi:GTP cyclohydrolase IA
MTCQMTTVHDVLETAVDEVAAEHAARALLVALGQNLDDEHLRETPRRMARAYGELLAPRPFDMTTFANDEGYDGLILVTAVPFRSLCAHHLLPFHGVAHVGYVPDQRLVGLSKLARVVEWFAAGLQVQERITTMTADCLDLHLAPRGVGVVLEAEHQCMALRGACAVGARTTTCVVRGELATQSPLRAEFLARTGRAAS